MKNSFRLLAIVLLITATLGSLAPQSGYDQFQKALAKERVEGKLEEAIALYQKVIEGTKDESLAANAQLRIGICYEKLGQARVKQALEAFQKVVDKYPTQADAVKMAREKLLILAKAQASPPPAARSLTVRKLSLSDFNGSPSPDGSFMTFTDWGKGNLGVRDLVLDSTRNLTNNATVDTYVNHSVVSPDNRRIAYSWYGEDGQFGLWLINVDGSGNRLLCAGQEGWNIEPLDWSPDGSQILAAHSLSYPSRACQIVFVAVSDGSMKVIKELGRKVPSRMCFSPDGRFIVYDYPPGQSTTSDIFVLTADGSKEIPLIENPANDRVLGWTPDGQYVMFASDRAGSWGAWLVPVKDGQVQGTPRLIKQDIGLINPMGFARDGTFYYGIGGWAHDVYTQDVDLEGEKLLGMPELAVQGFIGSNGMPAWSPDGEHLAYISGRTPARSSAVSFVLCIRNSKSGKDRELVPELDWYQWPRWSSDGRAMIVLGSDRSNHLGEYKIDAVTGAVSPVLLEEKDNYQVANLVEWSHDGRSVYYVRNDWKKQTSELILRSLDTKQERKIAGYAGKNRFFTLLSLSPDGGSLIVLVLDENQKSKILTLMPAQGGEQRELLELKGKEGFALPRGFAWAPDSRKFLFAKFFKMTDQEQPSQGRNELWLLSTDTGERRKLGDLMNGPGVEISLHPNGRSLVFSANAYKSEVWAMENFLPGAGEGLARGGNIGKPALQKPTFRKIRTPFSIPEWSGARLSSDGKTLAFGSGNAVWTVPIPGRVDPDLAGEPRELPGAADVLGDGLSWSGDGKWIAFSRTYTRDLRGGGTRIKFRPEGAYIDVVPSSGGEPKRIPVPQWVDTKGDTQRGLSLSPNGKVVAFDSGGQIYVASVATGGIKQVTKNGGVVPCFSPDGTKIAYLTPSVWQDNPPVSLSEVRVISADGGDSVKVSGDLRENLSRKRPIWSPDGRMIAFGRMDRAPRLRSEVCIVPVSETGTPLAPPVQIELPLFSADFMTGWTPDNKIGLLLETPYHEYIYTVPVSGGKATQSSPIDVLASHPRWTPDGKRIFFRWERGGLGSVPCDGGEVSVHPAHKGAEKNGFFTIYPGAGNSVSPDGKSVAFSAGTATTGPNIYTIPLEEGGPRQIATGGRYPCWSPDGKWIAYLTREIIGENKYVAAIFRIPAEGGEAQRISKETDAVTEAGIDWSPDGKMIAYFSKKADTPAGTLNVVPVGGGESREVCRIQNIRAHDDLSWSPDGQKIAFTSKGKIWVVSADGGEPLEVKTDVDADAGTLDWSPDGRKIAFSGDSGMDIEFWFMEDFLRLLRK